MFALRLNARSTRKILFFWVAASVSVGCDQQRQRDCEALLKAMKPMEAQVGGASAVPPVEVVASVAKEIGSLKPNDQPLQIYAGNCVRTLSVLSSTLDVKASSAAPDGTDDVIRKSLAEARAQIDDVKRYCAE